MLLALFPLDLLILAIFISDFRDKILLLVYLVSNHFSCEGCLRHMSYSAMFEFEFETRINQ